MPHDILRRLRRMVFGPTAKEICHNFAEQFPGRCMICALHAYGLRHGLERSPAPPPHRCIEQPTPTA